jgi:hypothetical protein
MADAYTEAEVNAAIARVETAKQNHPAGWSFLAELNLRPPDSFAAYAFTNAVAHARRLRLEDDVELVYAAAWMNGLAVGVALGEGRK